MEKKITDNGTKNTALEPKVIPNNKSKKIARELIWLSISEAAKIGGVQNKTIRRALKSELKFKIKGNRYFIDFSSLIIYLHRNKKLKNKLQEHGVGQYIQEWKIDNLNK